MSNPRPLDLMLAAIAPNKLGVETFEARNSDHLDFHEVHVGELQLALALAAMAPKALKVAKFEKSTRVSSHLQKEVRRLDRVREIEDAVGGHADALLQLARKCIENTP